MLTFSSVSRRCAAGLSCAALLVGTGLLSPTTAASVGGALHIGLQPNHKISSKPPGGGHGGGGGGGGSSLGWQSSNWSGYATTSPTPFTGVRGNWSVPSVGATSSPSYSAAWVGIDGFNNNSLIQTGTEQDYYNGASHYTAWWTTSAQNFGEQLINEPVSPGDPIIATITKTDSNTSAWSITLQDASGSHGWTFNKSLTYTGPGASAEWILEAPTVGGRIAQLAHYSLTTFDPGTIDGNSNPNLVAPDGGELVQGFHSQVVSIPSGPDNDTDGFNINYGSTPPSAPGS
ncbi:MAG TPA: G1 family glutamic endopeptidase [Acidimicrobiales bacterium]|nr:G1 family glutamic endopeptidase [Acidimicrobiales bacterium]